MLKNIILKDIKKFKVGIAGYGVVGKRRKHFIDQHLNLEVIALCDKNLSGIDQIDSKIKLHTNYLDLLKEDLDVVFVCMTNDIAPEVTIKSLESGRPVFCEKPPGRTVKDIVEVIKAEKQTKLKLKYGFNHRYHESVILAKKKIDSGEYGDIININGVYGKSRIVSFEGGWRSKREVAGGGILLDQGIHMLDLMRFFVGEFSEIKSFVSNSFWNHDVEDNAYALLKSKKGIVAILNSSATIWEHKFSLRINLTKGFIELTGLLTSSKSYGEEKLTSFIYDPKKISNIIDTSEIKFLEDNSWEYEINEFVDCITNDLNPKYGSSEDALETMKLVYRIYEDDNDWVNKQNINEKF